MIDGHIDGSLPSGEVDWVELCEQAATLMYASVMENFAVGGRPTWVPRKDGTPATLFQSGRLKGAIQMVSGNDFAEVFISNGQVPYAFIHQFSGYAGRNHAAYIPARPYMMFQDEDKERLVKMFAGEVIKMMSTPKKHRSSENDD